jgi:hypothetical protein
MQWGGGGSGSVGHHQTPSVTGGGSSLLSPLPGSLLLNFPVTPALPHSSATGGAGVSGSHHASSAFHSDLGMGMLSPFGSSNVAAGGGAALPPHTYPVVPAAPGSSTAAVSSSSTVLPAAPQAGSLEYRQLSASGQNALMDGGTGGALGLRGESSTVFGLGLGLGLRGESSNAFAFDKDPFGSGGGGAGSSSNSSQAAHDFLRQASANANMQPFQ